MISRTVSRTDLSDVTQSSSLMHTLGAVARELDEAYFQMDRLKDLWSLDKASGSDLDARAKDIQPAVLTRTLSRASVGGVIFSRAGTTGTITIPSGTLVKTGDGVVFRTAVQTQILTGNTDSVLTSIVAVERGADGNVDPNTVIKFGSKIPGVDSVTNPSATTQGRDEETDDSFRERLKAYIRSLDRTTPHAQEFAAIGVEEESGKVVVFAHLFEDPVDNGETILYIDDGLGTAEETLLSTPSGDISELAASSGGQQLITDNGEGLFLINMIGRDFTVAGADPSNNGTFTVLDVPTANTIIVDNGSGIAETPGSATWTMGPEIVTRGLVGPPADSAVGGEEYLNLDSYPVKVEVAPVITSSTRGALTLGTDVFLDPATGLLYFDPPLVATEVITASYTYFTGLIKEVQNVIYGDENDRENFPGYRAGGVRCRVLSPTVVSVSVEATLIFDEGVDAADVIADAETAVSEYINTLGISNDVVRNEIIDRVMGVPGIVDMNLILPSANVTILDDQIARALSANIDIS